MMFDSEFGIKPPDREREWPLIITAIGAAIGLVLLVSTQFYR